MRILGVFINGILDLKNMYPVGLELYSKYSIVMDLVEYREDFDVDREVYRYDAVLVGSDWNQNRKIVEAFNGCGKKTVLLQSEGVFVDEAKWYGGLIPGCRLACVWGERHKRIFKDRGYGDAIVVAGPPRFDSYFNFQPKISKSDVYRLLDLPDLTKPYILFLGQYFNVEEWGLDLAKSQRAITQLCCEVPDNYYSIMKCHPQETREYLEREEISYSSGNSNVRVIDVDGHAETVEISTLLYHAHKVVSFSSTASVEAALMGIPSFVYSSGLESPIQNGKIASLPQIKSIEELISADTAVNMGSITGFLKNFLPGPIDGKSTVRASRAIAAYLRC